MNIRSISTEALECRDNRCQWERERKHDQREPGWGTYRWDLCTRCGNWKSRIQCNDGRVLSETTRYEYTDHYEEALRYTREDARLELDRRANAKTTTVVRGGRGSRNLRVVAS